MYDQEPDSLLVYSTPLEYLPERPEAYLPILAAVSTFLSGCDRKDIEFGSGVCRSLLGILGILATLVSGYFLQRRSKSNNKGKDDES